MASWRSTPRRIRSTMDRFHQKNHRRPSILSTFRLPIRELIKGPRPYPPLAEESRTSTAPLSLLYEGPQRLPQHFGHGRGQQFSLLPPHARDLLFAARDHLAAAPILELQSHAALGERSQSHPHQDFIEGYDLFQVFTGAE